MDESVVEERLREGVRKAGKCSRGEVEGRGDGWMEME